MIFSKESCNAWREDMVVVDVSMLPRRHLGGCSDKDEGRQEGSRRNKEKRCRGGCVVDWTGWSVWW